ncbi:MAG: TFIIB-type zinc ribbon-containing protein, partial [Candidatus Micrarchaeales archaeon]
MEIVQSNESHNGDSCPNCKNSELTEDENRGELFCKKCGYVAPQKLEEYDLPHGTDKHGVSTDSSGVAYRYGRSSIIDKANKDFTGKNIQGEMKQSLDRLRVWDTRASANDNKVRSMNKAAPKIMGWCSSLGVNENAISEAIRIYAKAQKAGITRGRSINTIALASIKIACKLNN